MLMVQKGGTYMSNLGNFNNIHANLSESAYNDRPNNFPLYKYQDEWTKNERTS